MKKIKSVFILLVVAVLSFVAVAPAVYAEEDEIIVNDAITVNDDFQKIDAGLAEYTFEFKGDDTRYVVIKQASTYIVFWTEKEIAKENQAEFIEDFKAINKDGKGALNFDNPVFIHGYGSFDLGKALNDGNFGVYTFEKDGDNVKLYCDASKISHADYGTYVNLNDKEEPEVEYEWRLVGKVGDDSATGFGTDNYSAFTKGGNWFQAQHLNFAGLNEIVLDIQAGNFKNGTNFIGKVTLIKDGNKYTMNYKVNDNKDVLPSVEAYELGDTVVLTTISGPKYLASTSKVAIKNNGKDLKAYKNGDSFKMDTEDFHFYTHFDVTYTKYELVVKE